MIRPNHPHLHNAFTVDVEDYFQVSGFERHINREQWHTYESRVERNTQRILDLLDEHHTRGTFFVLGWIADRYPQLVREIHDRGHEIGSHSYWHRLVYDLTPNAFRADVRRSRDALQNVIGQPVTVYRAPSFSITGKSLWALEILIEEGFLADSSVFPVHHDRYGIPKAERRLHMLNTPSGSIWEFPPSVVRTVGVNLPVSGGGYFRLYPSALTHAALHSINKVSKQPFVFYVHPWEIDPEQPRLPAGTRISRWRHYVNLSRTERKLSNLLKSFRFTTIGQVIEMAHEG